jgi:hypothetical protein
MRTLLQFLAIIAAFGMATAGLTQTKASKPNISLAIGLRESTVKAGSLVVVEITKKNISNHDMNVRQVVGSAEWSYDVVVTDEENKPAPTTDFGRRKLNKEPYFVGSIMIDVLKPGESMHEIIALDRMYDFSRAGKYTIQVSQTVYASDLDVKAGVKTTVKSNVVMVTVTP